MLNFFAGGIGSFACFGGGWDVRQANVPIAWASEENLFKKAEGRLYFCPTFYFSKSQLSQSCLLSTWEIFVSK